MFTGRLLHSIARSSRKTLKTETLGVRTMATIGAIPRIMLENPWDSSSPLSAVNNRIRRLPVKATDQASRYAIQLLQELYLSGRPRTRDIITTERCNAVLRQIATANPGYLKTVVWSDHAHAILETMEAFHPLTKPDDFLSQRRAMSFPTPDLQTYQMVVDIDSRTEGPLEIALRAQRTIEQLYLLYKEGGNVDLKPTKFMWTMVFMTWKQCTDPESPAHAGTLLLRLFNEQPGDLSMASVAAVLTTCAKVYNDDTSSTLGSRIAIKICQHSLYNLEDQLGESPKSQFYTVFFRALRSVSTADKMRAQYFASVFDHACRRGKVNSLVLAAFMSNASDNELMVRYFGEDVQLLTGLPIEDATAILLNKMPLEWKENAD